MRPGTLTDRPDRVGGSAVGVACRRPAQPGRTRRSATTSAACGSAAPATSSWVASSVRPKSWPCSRPRSTSSNHPTRSTRPAGPARWPSAATTRSIGLAGLGLARQPRPHRPHPHRQHRDRRRHPGRRVQPGRPLRHPRRRLRAARHRATPAVQQLDQPRDHGPRRRSPRPRAHRPPVQPRPTPRHHDPRRRLRPRLLRPAARMVRRPPPRPLRATHPRSTPTSTTASAMCRPHHTLVHQGWTPCPRPRRQLVPRTPIGRQSGGA